MYVDGRVAVVLEKRVFRHLGQRVLHPLDGLVIWCYSISDQAKWADFLFEDMHSWRLRHPREKFSRVEACWSCSNYLSNYSCCTANVNLLILCVFKCKTLSQTISLTNLHSVAQQDVRPIHPVSRHCQLNRISPVPSQTSVTVSLNHPRYLA